MASVPEAVAGFLSGKRLAVAGVSRDTAQPANARTASASSNATG